MVKVKTTTEIDLTPENEAALLDAEFQHRYGDNPFELGDDIRFTSNGRGKQREYLGEDHVGRLGIVVAIGVDDCAKVLAINPTGDFVEVWTSGACVEKVA